MKKDFFSRLVYARKYPLIGKLAYFALKFFGIEIPLSVEIGNNFYLVHGGFGVVIHPKTKIADNVRIYPGVTLGRADVHVSIEVSDFEGIIIEENVILSAGAKLLCKSGTMIIGAGSMIGANAVLLESTGENEIWAGIPAKKIGLRD